MRKNQLPSWSVETHNWSVEKRSLFRVVNPTNFRLSLRGHKLFQAARSLYPPVIQAIARWPIASLGSIII
jgi:hypothetical protein